MPCDQAGIHTPGGKLGMGDNAFEKVGIGGDAHHLKCRQRLAHAGQCRRTCFIPDDQLGDHRVVEGRDGVALHHAAVDSDMAAGFRGAEVV